VEIDTLEYSRVKSTMVSVSLRIYLWSYSIPSNMHSGAIVGDINLVAMLASVNKLSGAVADQR
jgi:hypothetical protein